MIRFLISSLTLPIAIESVGKHSYKDSNLSANISAISSLLSAPSIVLDTNLLLGVTLSISFHRWDWLLSLIA